MPPARLAVAALGLLMAIVPATVHAQCAAIAENQFLRLRKVFGTAATRFYYVGTIPGPIAANPLADGLRLVLDVPGAGITTIDVTLPSGPYDPIVNRGWTADGETFFYRDSHGAQAGIMRALVKHLDSGDLKVSLFGQTGSYPVPLIELPTDPRDEPFGLEPPIATRVMLDPSAGMAGPCAEGVIVSCRYRNRGGKLICY